MKLNNQSIKPKIQTFLAFIFLFHAQILLAENNSSSGKYVLLSGNDAKDIFPNLTNDADLGKLFNDFYKWGVGMAVLIALVYVVVGGIQYMTTDAIYDKGQGRKRIQNAFLGLMIALSSYLILNTINESIVTTTLSFGSLQTNATKVSTGEAKLTQTGTTRVKSENEAALKVVNQDNNIKVADKVSLTEDDATKTTQTTMNTDFINLVKDYESYLTKVGESNTFLNDTLTERGEIKIVGGTEKDYGGDSSLTINADNENFNTYLTSQISKNNFVSSTGVVSNQKYIIKSVTDESGNQNSYYIQKTNNSGTTGDQWLIQPVTTKTASYSF